MKHDWSSSILGLDNINHSQVVSGQVIDDRIGFYHWC